MRHAILESAEAELKCGPLMTSGNLSLLDRPRRMLLISRGERHPQPQTPWLRHTVSAVRACAANGEVLVAGLSRVAYETALWVTRKENGAAIVVLDREPESDLLATLPRSHLLIWPAKECPAREVQSRRDALIAQFSDRAWAIHVRSGGNMAKLAARLTARDVPVETWPDSERRDAKAVRKIRKATPVSESAPSISEQWNYLTHFTREPDGPWPGEPRTDYLNWLCSGAAGERRDGFAALCRILELQRIIGCGRLIPGGAPMVCLTALHPQTAYGSRRWRRGLLRWTFSPYGICIRRHALTDARPVHYVSDEAMKTEHPTAQSFLQRQKSGGFDWTQESEWRSPGDVDLSDFRNEDMIACVSTRAEAEIITARYSLQTLVLTDAQAFA